MFGSTLPAEIKDAASATLALLRTATVIRLEGGEIWAWEGQHTQDGSCEGTCTHVWNYQQALPHLFPALERTLRETEFTYNQLPTGGLTFRQKLPLGAGFDVIGPCADGHFGAVIKTYRDWKLSGDTEWLKRYWPKVRRAVEYAWSKDNPDRWDPDANRRAVRPPAPDPRHGAVQPEFLARLDLCGGAACRLGNGGSLGEQEFADTCGKLGRNGAKYIDDKLFNGRWFVQDIDLSDRSVLAPFDTGRKAGVLADGFMETYWSDEHSELKYQMGEGCITDQILGQWHAEVAGLGGFLDDGKVATALKAVHANNFRPASRTISTRAATTPMRTKADCWWRPIPRVSASRWSRRPTPRRCGPASNTCRPRT